VKVAIVTDTHFGARGDSLAFSQYFKKFFEKVFWPTVFERCEHVLHLGDLVDRRKYINFNSCYEMGQAFIKPAHEMGWKMTILAGNHDAYFKNTLRVNAVRELVPSASQFTVIDYPTPFTIDPRQPDVLLVPWICDDNRAQCEKLVTQSTLPVCMGHLEFTGFEMYRGQVMDHGADPAPFSKFRQVFSGHYHHRSSKGNIHYLGAPYEMTWGDYDDPRGFHIWDTESGELEFIENPYKMHKKVHYEPGLAVPDVRDSIVKVILPANRDPFRTDAFITALETQGVADLKAVEDHLNLDVVSAEEVVADSDTLDIIRDCVNDIKACSVDKGLLTGLLVNLYKEAQLARE